MIKQMIRLWKPGRQKHTAKLFRRKSGLRKSGSFGSGHSNYQRPKTGKFVKITGKFTSQDMDKREIHRNPYLYLKIPPDY